MLKWLLFVAVALVAIVALVALFGMLLPQNHVASRAAIFHQPPDALFAIISDVASAASWRTDITKVEMLPPIDGRVRFREVGKMDGVVMEVQEVSRPTRLITRIADPDQPFGGTWTFDLASVNGGTRLAITERGEVYNPIFRALGRFVFGYTSTMDGYLRALGKKLGEEVTPGPYE